MLLSGLILLLPMALFFLQIVLEKQTAITHLEDQQKALQLAPKLFDLLDQTSRYRGLSQINKNSRLSDGFLLEEASLISANINQLKKLIENISKDYRSQDKLQTDLDRVEALWLSIAGTENNFSTMSDINTYLNNILMHLVSNQTDLTRILTDDIPLLRESLAQIRGAGAGYLAQAKTGSEGQIDDDYSTPALDKLKQYTWLARNRFIHLRDTVDKMRLLVDKRNLSLFYEIVVEMQEVFDMIDWEMVEAQTSTISSIEFFVEASEPIDLISEFAIGLHQLVLEKQDQQIADYKGNLFWSGILVIATMLLVIVVTLLSARIWVTRLHSAVEILQRLGEGDFNQNIRISEKQGEISLLMKALLNTQNRLKSSHDQQQEANRSKDEFLASMSHELRTPLSSIIGNCEIIAERNQDPEIEKLNRAIESAGRTQLALVNDILDLSKIESGKFMIEEHPYHFDQIVAEILHMFEVRSQEARVMLEVHQQEAFTHQLIGDVLRVQQVLLNLISNGIKFTPQEGKVTLSVEQAGELLIIKVADTGVGMSKEVLERIFERFEQADSSTSRNFGGSGLGLYISYNLTELMKGTLHAESEEGVGSTFTLTLPYVESELLAEAVDQGEAQSMARKSFHGKVLVAEDTPSMQELARYFLSSVGIDVMVVENGEKAVSAAADDSFDMVLMDMQMPVMDGIEATMMLRKIGCDTPIIALTANVMQVHRDAFEEAGVNGFLAKPIDRQKLQRVLMQYLEEGEPLDVEEEEVGLSDELMQVFRTNIERQVEEIKQAHQTEDWAKIRSIAHAVKGTGSSYGYPGLTELGKEVCDKIDYKKLDGLMDLVSDLIAEMEDV